MRRARAATLAACLLALALPGPALGWGGEAHRAAAAVMTARLCPAADRAMQGILADWSLEDAVTWPDRIRDDAAWAHTRDWHYMNVPDATPVVPGVEAEGGRILEAIRAQLAVLADTATPAARRREALAFVLHLVVDLHQPLHVGRAEDRGGNTVTVRFEEREMSLHRLWDSQLLRSARLRPEDYARTLAPLAALGAAGWADGSLEDWADESRRLRPWVYDFDKRRRTPQISRRYAETGRQLTALRLAQAGVRSAGLLNGLWCR